MSNHQRPAPPVRENGISTGRRRADILNGHTGVTARPDSKAQVAAALSIYLSKRLGVTGLGYSEPPSEITNGWDSYTYRFRLKGPAPLPPDFARPLAVSIYCGAPAIPRARHEFAVQGHVHHTGYPAPKPLLLEERCGYFGGPFLLKPLAPGRTLLETLLQEPRRIWREPARMAELHARLHRLPPYDFRIRNGTLFPRTLEEMAEINHTYGLRNLMPGLDWLVANQPDPPEVASILHLDFHPYNLIQEEDGSLTVIDWTEAGVGDFHADVAESLMILKCMPAGRTALLDGLAVGPGRFLLRRWYLRAYRKLRAIDEAKLRYYRAWSALRRLCQYERWLRDGPQVTGSKSHLLEHLRAEDLQTLRKYYHKWSGVRILGD